MTRRFLRMLPLLAWLPMAGGQTAGAKPLRNQTAAVAQDGVRAEFRIETPSGGNPGRVSENTEVRALFQLRDAITGAPLKGLRPAAWMDLRTESTLDAEKSGSCKQKIRSFVQRGLGYRPAIDLNRYFILALNEEASISVIDPLLGFGSSKLLTTVLLPSPGADWMLSRDRNRLFVALPAAKQLAVVDTESWRISRRLAFDDMPTRLALQPDGRYLWVGTEGTAGAHGSGGIRVIDTESLKTMAELPVGAGPHRLAFTEDSRYAFVGDSARNAVHVIDVARLIKVKELELSAAPAALAYSPLAKAVYVGQADGKIAAIDARKHEITSFLSSDPGLTVLRFSPDGRWGFAASGMESRVFVFDAATHQPVGKFEVGAHPDQIAFTDHYAYVRSGNTPQIGMIQLGALKKGEGVSVAHFSAGQAAPKNAVGTVSAEAITPAPEPNSMLVANSGDKTIYYYSEGMAAPMGSFQNYGHVPRAIQVVDRSLRETAPGIYSAGVTFPQSGSYDVALLLDNPRVERCFLAKVERASTAGKPKAGPPAIEYLIENRTIRSGQPVQLQFQLTAPSQDAGTDRLQDVEVQLLATPGNWSRRAAARPLGGSLYETRLTAPRPGVYYVFVQSPSQGIRFEHLPNLILRAVPDD